MKNLMNFEGNDVEVFEYEDKVLFNPYHVGRCLNLAESSVRYSMGNMNGNQKVKLKKSTVGLTNNLDIPMSGKVYLTESGVYKLIFKSRKKEAERFSDWVTDEVLPSIRKTGKYDLTKEQDKDFIFELKTFRGEPVMTIRDLASLYNVQKETINYVASVHSIGTVLAGKELEEFKSENQKINMKNISVLRVFNRDGVMDISNQSAGLKLRCDGGKISEYFDRSSLSDYERLKLLELATDILNIANLRGQGTPYEKMLNVIASKIYVDCGFTNEVTDDLSTHKTIGWNLIQPLNDFKNKIRKRLV